jgi:hypothetical protein
VKVHHDEGVPIRRAQRVMKRAASSPAVQFGSGCRASLTRALLKPSPHATTKSRRLILPRRSSTTGATPCAHRKPGRFHRKPSDLGRQLSVLLEPWRHQARAHNLVALGLTHPAVQCLRRAPDLDDVLPCGGRAWWDWAQRGCQAKRQRESLRQLREQGLLTLRNGSVKIHDPNRLRKLAGFQGYLNFRATGPTDTDWGRPPKTLTYAREAPH